MNKYFFIFIGKIFQVAEMQYIKKFTLLQIFQLKGGDNIKWA